MEELREKLAEIINNSQLPFECKFYVLKDVYNEVNNIYYRELLNQKKEVQNQNEEKGKENSIEDSKE